MPNLLILCFSLFFIPALSQQQVEFVYKGFKQPSTKSNITLSGTAEYDNSGLIRLTNDTSRLAGHVFYNSPLRFKNSPNGSVSSFTTCFAFVIVPEYEKLGGHGLAFAVSSTRDLKTALPSQYLGLLNATDVGNSSNHLVAVEFDTVRDLEFGDVNDNHVGVDINSLVSGQSAAADLNLKSSKPVLVWVEYDSSSTLINVSISNTSVKPNSPIISYRFDLSSVFQEEMYIGFSASTGLLASSHYILGWSFKMNGVSQSLSLSSLPSLPGPKKNHTVLIIAVTLSSLVFILSAILASLYIIKKIKNREVIEDWEVEIGPHRYSYKELKKATHGFKASELLGAGGFGSVYKGTLPNSKTLVAVKRVSQESNQGLREFVSEIATIGRLRHRNLVQLIGWCRRRRDLMIVYEFMPNGSLDVFLFESDLALKWEERFKIIKGVASGLLYLHEGYEQSVIHRDVKASNVLLDAELNGKLGDFGLARLSEHGANPSTTRVVGTLGYLAPELPRSGHATTKSDVFAFGALCLEVVCGRRPIEPKAAPEELVLVDWVWDKWKQGNVFDAVDPKLMGEFDEAEVVLVLKLGFMCSNDVALARPDMRQVVRYLEGEAGVPEDLRPPAVDDAKENGEHGFDEFLNSFESASFDKSTSSFPRRDAECSSASISPSPLSLLYRTDEAR